MRFALLAVLGSACASLPAPVPAPAGVARYADGIDWAGAGDEAVSVLSRYLQVDTRNPPGNETLGATFLATVLNQEGISSAVHEFAPGRGSLVAQLKSDGPPEAPPLCLLSHIDVVSAEAQEWPEDTQPLSGVVKDGFVWGRGALDMKGMGVLELLTFVWLKRAHVPLRRNVVLIAVADEEVHNRGMHFVVDTLWDQLGCGVLINEGGLGLKNLLVDGQTVFPITVAEKGAVWLRVVAQGEAGHGSTPVPGRAPDTLRRALDALATREPEPRMHPALLELLWRAGAHHGGLTGFVFQHPTLVNLFVLDKLLATPPTRAVITDTCQVTGFEGKGGSPNVIPSEVAALVDCRVLPGTLPDALVAELRALLAPIPNVRIEVLAHESAQESPWTDPFFDALARQLSANRPDVVVGPALSPGSTDSTFARPKGTVAYGLVPFELDGELLATMHGKNERVPVAQVRRGLEVLFRAVVDVSARP